jgi:tRNA threonylcarbamoyladenosine biosynthesis protein TsaB
MQKQKIMNYLAIQTTYEQLVIGLFDDNQLIDQINEDKKKASTTIILHIDDLLKKNKISLQNLAFIAVNQGPAPFTSLRVVIATVNGISFARGLPLVGVDALDVFIYENADPAWPYTVALLNAFNNDVYFAFEQPKKPIEKGCTSLESFLAGLQEKVQLETVRFIGNGAELYKNFIEKSFGDKAYFPEPIPQYPSLYRIGLAGLKNWQKKENINYQTLPLYLKQVSYKKSLSQQ